MKEQTVRNLIDAWGHLHKATAPSPRLLSLERDARVVLEDLSFLSSRREYWECFVCLAGYADQVKTEPTQLLNVIGQEIDDQNISAQTENFLNYCENFSSVTRETIPSVVNTIFHLGGKERPTKDVFRMTQFDVCLKLYPNPEDVGKFLACLKSGANADL